MQQNARGKAPGSAAMDVLLDNEDQRRARVIAGVNALGIPGTWEVGGCVRSRLTGREPQDYDFMAVGVTAEELLRMAKTAGHASELEVAGQIVGVRLTAPFTPDKGIEIALARTEVSTGPGRRDFAIEPMPLTSDLSAQPVHERTGEVLRDMAIRDLDRRDLTCNAVAQNTRTGEILDPHGGIEDIKNGILRAVSPDTFRDDPLRCFRVLPRMAHDGAHPDPQTEQMIIQWTSQLRLANLDGGDTAQPALAQERVRDELLKTLSGPHAAEALRTAADWGLLQRAIPEFAATVGFDQRNEHHELTVDQHILQTIAAADRANLSDTMKLALLCHDIAKPTSYRDHEDGGRSFRGHDTASADIARSICARLRLDRRATGEVTYLVAHHMFQSDRDCARRPVDKQDRTARKFLARHGLERSMALCALRRCDRAGKTYELPEPANGVFDDINAFELSLRRNAHHPHHLKDLAITGGDLTAMGLPPGPNHGEILRDLLSHVVADPQYNEPELLRLRAARHVLKATEGRSTTARQLIEAGNVAKRRRRERHQKSEAR